MNGKTAFLRLAARIAVAGLVLAAASCATAPKEQKQSEDAFSFVVIGDTPYSKYDAVFLEEKAVPAIKAGGFPFIVHVGDTKSGGAPCTDETDADQASLIAALAPAPVFYTPGDNEWTDCDRFKDPATAKPMSELSRLSKLRDRFFTGAVAAPKAMQARRQAALPENETWVYDGVRFVTLHVVGTNNGRDSVMGDPLAAAEKEVEARDGADLAWLGQAVRQAEKEKARALVIAMQADMTAVSQAAFGKACTDVVASGDHPCDAFVALRAAVQKAARDFGGPVLLIHGDTAPFTLGQSFAGEGAPNLWRLNAAGDVYGHAEIVDGGVRDVTLVTITPGAAAPFAAKGYVTGAAPQDD